VLFRSQEADHFQYPSKSEVFERALRGIEDYYWASDRRWYNAIVCWILGTYVHPIFTYYPILNAQGLRETGKTTLLDLVRSLAWNSTARETALREAGLFRSIQDCRPTYVLDVTKISGKQWHDIVDVCETGTEKGGVVTRVSDTGEPLRYATFGPKAIATRFEVPFLPKCIRLLSETPPTEKRKDLSAKRAYLDVDPRWPDLTRDMLKTAVKYWPEMVDAYRKIEQTEKLVGRRFNYWSPLLTICKVFSPDRFVELLHLAEEDAETCESGDDLSEVENAILNILLTFAKLAEDDTFTLLLKVVTEKTQELLPWVKDWHMVKSAIENLSVARQRYQVKNGVTYRFDVERVRAKAEVRHIRTEEPPKNSEPKEATLTQENVTLVFESLYKACQSKEYATIGELVLSTGLAKEELQEILGELQSDGKASQPRPDMWRPVV
jgi:hypothetical protein